MQARAVRNPTNAGSSITQVAATVAATSAHVIIAVVHATVYQHELPEPRILTELTNLAGVGPGPDLAHHHACGDVEEATGLSHLLDADALPEGDLTAHNETEATVADMITAKLAIDRVDLRLFAQLTRPRESARHTTLTDHTTIPMVVKLVVHNLAKMMTVGVLEQDYPYPFVHINS